MHTETLAVDFSSWQFAITAAFYLLFVSLTIGLSWIILAVECLYVKKGHKVYKDMAKFWGILLSINFAFSVLTGLALEFELGTNWAYFSQFVSDAFGTPLAIGGLITFMLESTFFGLFFFGFDKFSKKQHLLITFGLALFSVLSLSITMIANSFMQHPVGATFNMQTMRLETTNLWQIFTNPLAQVNLIHTILSSFILGSVFVMGVSSFYILTNKDIDFAKRSMAIAIGFGLVSISILTILGGQNELALYRYQPTKLAAIKGQWITERTPSNFSFIAWPDQKRQENFFEINVPNIIAPLIRNHQNKYIYGLKDIMYHGYKNLNSVKQEAYQTRIVNGAKAYDALINYRKNPTDQKAKLIYQQYKNDLGFGMMLLPFVGQGNSLEQALNQNPSMLEKATRNSIPNVFIVYWSYRIMTGAGILLLIVFLISIYYLVRNTLWQKKWILKSILYMIPIPFISSFAGFMVSELGRQPWALYMLLPTKISSSSLNVEDIFTTMILFIVFNVIIILLELYLMVKLARIGPNEVSSGRYHIEGIIKNNKA